MFFHYVLGFPLRSDVTAAGHVTKDPYVLVSGTRHERAHPAQWVRTREDGVYWRNFVWDIKQSCISRVLHWVKEKGRVNFKAACVVPLRCAEPNVAQGRRLCTHARIVERRETGSAGTRSPYTAGDVIGIFLWQDRGQGCPGRTLANRRQRL